MTPVPLPLWPCQQQDPDRWFADNKDEKRAARRLCQPCPNRQPCLDGALARREHYGVWGGELFGHDGIPITGELSRYSAAYRRRTEPAA